MPTGPNARFENDVSKGLAVRIAAQGPLASYFEGVQYDAATDSFKATSGRELIPLFTRIFEDAPQGSGDALGYLAILAIGIADVRGRLSAANDNEDMIYFGGIAA